MTTSRTELTPAERKRRMLEGLRARMESRPFIARLHRLPPVPVVRTIQSLLRLRALMRLGRNSSALFLATAIATACAPHRPIDRKSVV